MEVVHPIRAGWRSAGPGVGAQNYDEFADDAEITAIVRRNPDSMLAVEMPHLTPEAVAAGHDFGRALPAAVARLDQLRRAGRLVGFTDAVAVYRIASPAGQPDFFGVFCLVDTDQIATGPGHPGLVVRNEDVFAGKVVQRTALIRALGALASPVLLIQTVDGLHAELTGLVTRLGAPEVVDVDRDGREHAVWLLGPGPDRDRLLAAAGAGELVVADGNHRSLAAQQAGLPRFLAVVTTPASVTIQPYQRLVRRLDRPVEAVLKGLWAAGATPLGEWGAAGPPPVPAAGQVVLHMAGRGHLIELPPPVAGGVAERLDHAVVERALLGEVLGLAPDDPAIGYVGGDYPPEWLVGEVDAGRAAMAVLLAPVTVDDFMAVNLDRAKMPRKSTWFVPKARTGLVLADVRADL